MAAKKGILLHHWDADGICSSAILRGELGRVMPDISWAYFTPRIGNYFLDKEEMAYFEDDPPDELVIVDMAIPSDQVRHLSGIIPHMMHFDHHYQPPHNLPNVEHYNPVANGHEQNEYPAATFVLMEHFKRKVDLPTVLGVVGDLEHKVFDNERAGPIVKRYLCSRGLCYMDAMRMVDLINSNFRSDDMDGVRKASDVLFAAGEDPSPILFNEEWTAKARSISQQVQEWTNAHYEDLGGLVILRMSSGCNIISTVGRQLHRRCNKMVLLVNTGLKGIDQIYCRGEDLRPAINYARGKGLRAGGKTDAFGAVLEKGCVPDFLPGLIEVLTKNEPGRSKRPKGE